MNWQKLLFIFSKALNNSSFSNIQKFKFDKSVDLHTEFNQKYGFSGDLLDFFCENKTNPVHKWHHYIPIYDRYFARFRGKKIKMLEIGVSQGGSLQLWRKYFGPDAIIYGIDINPDCARFDDLAAKVRIGSQDNLDFLSAVVQEMGGVDIILDDGSHQMKHVMASLRHLFPLLENEGIYVIEDLHCAYWKKYGGGYRSKNNFFHRLRNVIDDMHHWYHGSGLNEPAVSTQCSGIHVHDSIVILEKNQIHRPLHSVIG